MSMNDPSEREKHEQWLVWGSFIISFPRIDYLNTFDNIPSCQKCHGNLSIEFSRTSLLHVVGGHRAGFPTDGYEPGDISIMSRGILCRYSRLLAFLHDKAGVAEQGFPVFARV